MRKPLPPVGSVVVPWRNRGGLKVEWYVASRTEFIGAFLWEGRNVRAVVPLLPPPGRGAFSGLCILLPPPSGNLPPPSSKIGFLSLPFQGSNVSSLPPPSRGCPMARTCYLGRGQLPRGGGDFGFGAVPNLEGFVSFPRFCRRLTSTPPFRMPRPLFGVLF